MVVRKPIYLTLTDFFFLDLEVRAGAVPALSRHTPPVAAKTLPAFSASLRAFFEGFALESCRLAFEERVCGGLAPITKALFVAFFSMDQIYNEVETKSTCCDHFPMFKCCRFGG